ncbi:MAG: DUF523 and DUF1722 domain-containing protein [Armatimonadota bacterium]|nr:DUF523 and DUF1722 domain-containing protein [Armatimonadota bacterium]MDW8155701.1 DUF523 and DUF1722 domain-containing protein [Armatimonadota bacterium]
MEPERPRIAVSACLLGQPVRFDGGHRKNRLLYELQNWVEFVPLCPEVEAGLGVPRSPVRLVRTPLGNRLVSPRSGEDLTERIRAHAQTRVDALRAMGVVGAILQGDSPTCAPFRARVYDPSGRVTSHAPGAFAAFLRAAWPHLPVESEGRLRDPVLREHFLAQVFALHRWQRFVRSGPRPSDLVWFHTREKLMLLAHSPARAAQLGRLVAGLDRAEDALEAYGTVFAEALATRATRARHVNVLLHAAGMLRDVLTPTERHELHESIDAYRSGWVPLVVPVRLVRAWVRRAGPSWLRDQTYLAPYPDALGLRNAV